MPSQNDLFFLSKPPRNIITRWPKWSSSFSLVCWWSPPTHGLTNIPCGWRTPLTQNFVPESFKQSPGKNFFFVNILIIALDFEGKVNRENVSRFYGRRKPCFVFQLEPKSFRSRLRLLYIKRLNWIRFFWSLFQIIFIFQHSFLPTTVAA